MRPKPIELFAFYHLGLDSDGTYKFRNLADCARRWNTDAQTIQQWLQESRIDAETAKTVPVNLSRWHVDAQFAARDQVPALVRDAWQAYGKALQQRSPGQFHFDVDYDDLWGDAAMAAHRAVADQDSPPDDDGGQPS